MNVSLGHHLSYAHACVCAVFCSKIWTKLGISGGDLNCWTQRCRQVSLRPLPLSLFLPSPSPSLFRLSVAPISLLAVSCCTSQTVVTSFCCPHDVIIGCRDIACCRHDDPALVTGTSLALLREVARLRTQQLPSLGMILRYLDLTTEQGYLVKRVHGEFVSSDPPPANKTACSVFFVELARGGCIGAYRWNASPSRDKDKPSDAQVREREREREAERERETEKETEKGEAERQSWLMVDWTWFPDGCSTLAPSLTFQIIIHFFCTYMDSQIPPSPQFHDGRTFSDQFLLKAPLKPG